MTISRPWYREPFLWLVFGIPALTVVGGFWTLALAERSAATDSIDESVTRTGQIQDSNLSPDRTAARLGLSAELVRDPVTGEGQLRVSGLPVLAPLWLDLQHPIESRLDQRLQLQPAGDHWRIARLPAADHDWRLRLQPADGAWRLVGRWRATQTNSELIPAIDGS